MAVIVRKYTPEDVDKLRTIWNGIVEEGNSFPQREPLGEAEAYTFFESQSFTGVAEEDGEILGLYILHPTNVGRCSHNANASYGVKGGCRGKGIGEKLVTHSLRMCRELGFQGLQFNAVVSTNRYAIQLYEKLGFRRVGVIPKGFEMKDGSLIDTIIFYIPTK